MLAVYNLQHYSFFLVIGQYFLFSIEIILFHLNTNFVLYNMAAGNCYYSEGEDVRSDSASIGVCIFRKNLRNVC